MDEIYRVSLCMEESMRLVLFGDDFRLGVIRDDLVVDASDVSNSIQYSSPQDMMNKLISNFDKYRGALEKLQINGSGSHMDQVRLRPPLPRPPRLICMAVNYMEDPSVTERPPINAFNKSSSSVIGHGDTVVLPSDKATIFEHEAELALVIGKDSKLIRAENSRDHIFGYLNFIDVSCRGTGPNGKDSFFIGKSWDTFGPMGPVLVTADEIDDPDSLQVKLSVQGELRQNYNTCDMAHKIPEVIEWVSWVNTLEPGDVISCGTNHLELGPLQDGDRVEMEISDFGKLVVNVSDDLQRTWPRETRAQREARLNS
mgnify:CR=1 FL=1